MNSKLCCCANNSSHSLISSLDRWKAGSQVQDDMGHPFHLIRYSISYEKINKKWNGRLKTSLRTAGFREALSIYFAAFPLRKQSFDLKNPRFGREFVKRFVVILCSFPALSVRRLVTHCKACAKCPWFPGTAQQVFEWGAEECVKENFFFKLFFV